MAADDLDPRVQALLRGASPEVRARLMALPELGAVLAAKAAEAAPALAASGLPVDELLAYWGERLGAEGDLRKALHGCRVRDLALALGCVRQHPQALAEVEAEHESILKGVARRLQLDRDSRADLSQQLRLELFVHQPERPAKIATYTGQGPLRSWLYIATLRKAMRRAKTEDHRRELLQKNRPSDSDGLLDFELHFIKRELRERFRDVFRRCLQARTPAERTLLRQHYLDGLSIDELAALHHVHRSTAARWLARLRQTLLDDVRQALGAECRLSTAEVDGLLAQIQSRVDLTLSSVLASAAGER